MDEYVYRIEEESDRHYRETDELDDYAKAVFARNKYEEYAKQFDMPDEIESVEYEEEDGYLEEDY
jgi:DNA helicase IV